MDAASYKRVTEAFLNISMFSLNTEWRGELRIPYTLPLASMHPMDPTHGSPNVGRPRPVD